jgi:hypothetical protein
MPISRLFARLSDTKKFRSLEQPVSLAECVPCYCNGLFLYQYTRLNHPVAVGPIEPSGRSGAFGLLQRQTFATLRTSTVDHGPPAFSGHSLSKSVGPYSFDFAGLIRSLHD